MEAEGVQVNRSPYNSNRPSTDPSKWPWVHMKWSNGTAVGITAKVGDRLFHLPRKALKPPANDNAKDAH